MAARENKDIFYVCDGNACGDRCSRERFGQCYHTSKIEHAENFDMITEDLYMEKERARGFEKVVMVLDIAVICIVTFDIVLMLIGV